VARVVDVPLPEAGGDGKRTFDAYVVVDWSASSTPRQGANSVWICMLEVGPDGPAAPFIANPPTRREAMEILADRLSDLVARDCVALVGFDFAFGYPQGFAERLRPRDPTWNGVWKELAARVRDGEDNSNNRFSIAAEMNRLVSGGPFPFWGCPEAEATLCLSTRRDGSYGSDSLPEYRLTEHRTRGPQPTWKLSYPGSVGGQTLLGIPCLRELRHHPWLAEAARVWPFETGLRPLGRPAADDWRLLFAEVYPSMLPAAGEESDEDEVRDRAQVRRLAAHFAALDGRGRLASLFAGSADLDDAERAAVEREEGWILGIIAEREGARPRRAYLRDPAAIYRRSFATIRTEADLARLPPGLEPLAVRLIHACGMPDVADDLAWGGEPWTAASAALAAGAPILVDAEMVGAGVIRARLPADNAVICTLRDPGTQEGARARRTTRSAAAVDLWGDRLSGAVVAIGNAPTALFRLLERLDEGAAPPAVILGFPVGFVGAAESKEALIAHPAGVPFVTLRGRRGGSAMAAAAVNALAGEVRP